MNSASEALTRLFHPDSRADPYAPAAELRALGPVHRTPLGLRLLTRYQYQDCAGVLQIPAWSHADEAAQLHPSVSAADAAHEMLRYEPPVQLTTRSATKPMTVAGEDFAPGDGVVVLINSGNRDESVFTDPDRLDVRRFDPAGGTRKHLAFSHGPHFCLGAPLARLESTVLFERLLRRAPDFEVLDLAPRYRSSVSMRGPETLPVRFR
ncbi:cytochrome P450 [Actinokineospora enzanensis]|uniref:cytochrome P450 n=1 Tax=Actinokineospora enzanensis TaxID=155975 RepID=UPI00037A75FF|nr:cytochrome P450 [Actinokineospora enzanensis]